MSFLHNLLLLKECGLIGDLLGSREVVGVLVDDSPLAVDGEDLNLQVEVRFELILYPKL